MLKQTRRLSEPLGRLITSHFYQYSRPFASETTTADQNIAGLPLAQKCKNLLAGNWRGQVTVIDAKASPAGSEAKVKSFLAEYASPRGLMPPAVLFNKQLSYDNIQNLEQSSLASLTIGRTDPPDLVQKLQHSGMRLPCLSLLGNLTLMQPAELGYVLRRSQKASSRLPGWPVDWESRAADPDILGYALHVDNVRYVDMTGTQHEVDFEEVDAAFIDPLAPGLTRLISSINSNERHATALRSFCAAYMDTVVSEAVMTQADRRGCTLMALPSPEFVQEPELKGLWREFRFDLSQEVNNVDAFMQRIDNMALEAAEMLSQGKPVS